MREAPEVLLVVLLSGERSNIFNSASFQISRFPSPVLQGDPIVARGGDLSVNNSVHPDFLSLLAPQAGQ
ncbi:MAG: hypothetical protein ACK56I_15415, partial [bacterium]